MRHLFRTLLCGLLVVLLCGSALAQPLCSDWFAAQLPQLTERGLIPETLQDADLTQTATRQEVCEMLLTFWTAAGYPLPVLPAESPFYDTSNEAVLACYTLELLAGYGNWMFGPDDPLSRQQMCCVLANLLSAMGIDTTVDMNALSLCIDGWSTAEWALAPAALMLDRGIIQGDDYGYLYPEGTLTREQALVTLQRVWPMVTEASAAPVEEPVEDEEDRVALLVGAEEPTDESAEEPTEEPSEETSPETPPAEGLGSAEETYEDKYVRIFGSLDAPMYGSAAEAEAHMVTITVPVWNFNTDHVKVQTSRTLVVHEAIADTVMAIFTEIFYGDEQFPIYSVAGYAWRGDGISEHNWGIAIDINPDENYYVYHGVPTVGSYWKPGEDPYSIPEDGDVVRAFRKYGFYWGGNAWRSSQDYMHFSYFGT